MGGSGGLCGGSGGLWGALVGVLGGILAPHEPYSLAQPPVLGRRRRRAWTSLLGSGNHGKPPQCPGWAAAAAVHDGKPCSILKHAKRLLRNRENDSAAEVGFASQIPPSRRGVGQGTCLCECGRGGRRVPAQKAQIPPSLLPGADAR